MSSNDDQKTRYEGKDADVVWDERLCIHVGECGRAANDLFVAGRDPWCQPDLVPIEEVIDVVSRCPSGALSFERKDGGEAEAVAERNTVHVSNNGPLYVQGDLDIDGAGEDQPALAHRAALCRCGASANKPFCDGAHEKAGFVDYGAVGEKGDGIESEGGKLTIKRIQNGPIFVRGNFSIVASSGRVAWRGDKAALCRCGASKNKPFCDGQHAEIGFEAD
jgi:CDGSH-type Zn-finger protein/uncharacterized Fe-S cluster protein YjdI